MIRKDLYFTKQQIEKLQEITEGQTRTTWKTIPAFMSGNAWLDLFPENT